MKENKLSLELGNYVTIRNGEVCIILKNGSGDLCVFAIEGNLEYYEAYNEDFTHKNMRELDIMKIEKRLGEVIYERPESIDINKFDLILEHTKAPFKFIADDIIYTFCEGIKCNDCKYSKNCPALKEKPKYEDNDIINDLSDLVIFIKDIKTKLELIKD